MSVICFGEILWDLLPAGKQPGGAPFNVAAHLRHFGIPAHLISSVGDDEFGAELRAVVASKGLSLDCIQRDARSPTGIVRVNVRNASEVTYDIVQPAAWDYIRPDSALDALTAQGALFVFGSLAARSATTRETLYGLLQRARFRVLDVNLRPPHYSPELVQHLLGQADLVKMNHHELAEIMNWFGQEAGPTTAMPWLAERFDLEAVCVTCAADGALLWTHGHLHRVPGVPVTVQDTIGSGDAFLAALLKGWLAGQEPADILRFACAAGALVATHAGATPAISEAEVHKLLTTQAG